MVVSCMYTLSGALRISCVLFFIGFTALQASAQLYPGLTGELLADAIRNDYTPGQVLNENQAKDTLYAKVFAEGDSVRCIYSGLSRYLPAGADPSQWLYGSGLEVESINLEHGWPQAKGAGEGTDGNTNMYHLFPSRTGINSDRANFPYRDIQDNQTQKWYYRGIEMNAKPNTNISAYSEFAGGMFEPRESVKGDIARGMFYFWTIYRQDALAADPVDEAEINRNTIISGYQGGKVNPFIVDCSLVMRTYCNELDECVPVATNDQKESEYALLFVQDVQQFIITGRDVREWYLQIIDATGRPVYAETIFTNEFSQVPFLSSGHYIGYVIDSGKVLSQKSFFK
jgi:Endonuclease I